MAIPTRSITKKTPKEAAEQKAKVLRIAKRLSQKHRKALKSLTDR